MKIKFAKNVALINFSQKPFFQNFFQNTKNFFLYPGENKQHLCLHHAFNRNEKK